VPHLGLIGPLAAWELRRLARRGTALRVRLAFLYAVFLALVAFAAAWFYPLPLADVLLDFGARRVAPAEAARFADAFALVLLEALLVVAVAVTPALAAGAVAEEKDRDTLALLLATQLTDSEIVFGKAAGRAAFVLLAALAAVPVLALVLPFGGVSAAALAVGGALVCGTVLLCAALGVSAACAAPDLRAAAVRAYGRAAVLVCGAFVPPLVLLSPFAVLAWVHRGQDPNASALGALYALAQVAVAVLVVRRAARALRLRDATAGPPPQSAFPDPPRPAPPPLVQPERAPRAARPPVCDADPVLWKDRHAPRPAWALPRTARAASAAVAAVAALLFLSGAWQVAQRAGRALQPTEAARLANGGVPPDGASWLLSAAAVFAAGRYLLPLAVGLSAAVAGERFRNTLDPLLCAPLDRAALLRSKVRAQVERGTGAAAVAVSAVGGAFATDGGPLLGAAAALLMLCGFGLVIGTGALLTVRCASDARAFRLLLPVAVLAAGWPAGAWNALALTAEAELPPQALSRALLGAAAACAVTGGACRLLASRALARGA
jgi:ABC-type transport system involved in multi-copper enzyme maturation permease subunit